MRKSRNPARRLLSQILALSVLISIVAMAPVRPVGAQEVSASWSYTGSLNTARPGAIATLLPNGKVLVVGGHSAAGVLASAELYDPSTGTWSFTGSLNVARVDCTAVLLGNGKVLVAGGYAGNPAGPLNTAELYDPATGEWSLTGNLSVPRAGHTATLLPNGKVLVAGGGLLGAFSAHDTAELYDPVTGTFSFTGKLSGTRVGHAATMLQDGRVLVAGGCGDEECFFVLGSAELYDPNTGAWTITGGMDPRYILNLTTLPNGKVLTAGGSGNFFPFWLNTAVLYDPSTGRWSGTGNLPDRRGFGIVTLLSSGKVLVAGGEFRYDSARPGHSEVFNSAVLYDPATGTWNTTASLNTARWGHSATLLTNGKALIVGGHQNDETPLRSAELYTTTGPGTVVTVSAASYYLTGLSSDAIAVSFGTGLANATLAATTLALPTELAGTTVKVKDSLGVERLAPLLYVSPAQVNYQIPAGTALGAAAVNITSGDGSVSSGVVLIKSVAPSLFAANGDGQGVAAALALRVKADGSQSYEEVVQFDVAHNKFVPRPVDLGPEGEQVYLVLFATGIRSRSSLSAVIASIGGAYAAVSFAGMQPDFAGLDQVNVLVPRSLIGRGEVDVLLTVDTQMANPVRIQIK